MTAKGLVLDIETAPGLADIWSLWDHHTPIERLRKSGYIMSYAAKWLGEDFIYSRDCRVNGEEDELGILQELVYLLDEADFTIAHNGDKFDLPWIRGRCIHHGVEIPSPYKQVDTLKTAKREFRFLSNRLDYLAIALGCSPKEKHKDFPGYELWAQCIKGNRKAWCEMERYNIQDIMTLEEVYLKMRPYMRNHPNVAVYAEDEQHSCPKCGSLDVHRRGHAYTNVGKYQRYRCNSCGGWSRTRFTELNKEAGKYLLVNA